MCMMCVFMCGGCGVHMYRGVHFCVFTCGGCICVCSHVCRVYMCVIICDGCACVCVHVWWVCMCVNISGVIHVCSCVVGIHVYVHMCVRCACVCVHMCVGSAFVLCQDLHQLLVTLSHHFPPYSRLNPDPTSSTR